MTVFRCVRIKDGAISYWTDAELAARPDAGQWRKDKQITTPGQPLRLSGAEAEELGVATEVVDNFADFKSQYGLENDPQLIEPGWATALIDVLNSPGVSWLLLFVGLAARYVELHAPGIGVGGMVARCASCCISASASRRHGGLAGGFAVFGRNRLHPPRVFGFSRLHDLRHHRRAAGRGFAATGQPNLCASAQRISGRGS